MPFFLRRRNHSLTENIDHPDIDAPKLKRTYQQLEGVNRLFLNTRQIYQAIIKPTTRACEQPISVLDVGCGGGDVLISLTSYFEADGIPVRGTGIDPDPRAIEFADSRNQTRSCRFLCASAADMRGSDEKYDVVISSHVVHHLPAEELPQFLEDLKCLAFRCAVVLDIRRSDLSYGLFRTFGSLLFPDSYTVVDGLTSIKRSYTPQEVGRFASGEWTVQRMFPFHFICAFQATSEEALYGRERVVCDQLEARRA